MIKINMSPVVEEVKVKISPKGPPARVPKAIPAIFGSAVALLLALYLFAYMRQSASSSNLSTTEQTLNELKEIASRAKALEESLPALKKKAEVFQTNLERRRVWSKLLTAISVSCPEDIQLDEISLTLARGGVSASHQSRELLIKGFYLTTQNQENSELIFAANLQKNQDLAVHYPRVLVAKTDPVPGKTSFEIRCSEQ